MLTKKILLFISVISITLFAVTSVKADLLDSFRDRYILSLSDDKIYYWTSEIMYNEFMASITFASELKPYKAQLKSCFNSALRAAFSAYVLKNALIYAEDDEAFNLIISEGDSDKCFNHFKKCTSDIIDWGPEE
jgi:hypothetical protein